MDRTFFLTFIPFAVLLFASCSTPRESVQSQAGKPEVYSITWENMDKFDDAPEFKDTTLDEPPRFAKNPKYGDPYYFKEGKIEIDLSGARGKAAAEKAAAAVLKSLFGDDTECYRITTIVETRFGYFVDVDWGFREEKYTGHFVRMMIDPDSRTIWWCKCS